MPCIGFTFAWILLVAGLRGADQSALVGLQRGTAGAKSMIGWEPE